MTTEIINEVDCNSDPFIPEEGWVVFKHKKGGVINFETKKINLYLSDKQNDDDPIDGIELQKELEGKNVLNTNILDYLLKNQHLIPEEWKSKKIYFWGTLYLSQSKVVCVCFLQWKNNLWSWEADCIGGGVLQDSPAATLD